MTSATASHRFETLGAMRGLVVLLLAVFHFSPIFLGAESPLLRHAYVTTNMFFGLSGFVLMAAYGHRLDTGARRLQFVWARLRRLYPLHVFTLGLVLVVPYFVYAVNWSLSWVLTGQYFGGLPTYHIDWEHVIGDLLMVHGLGYFDALHLNFPSWSLAALFFCSVLFAAVSTFPRLRVPIFVTLSVVSVAAIARYSPHMMDTTYDYGFLRCLASFGLGVAAYPLWKRFQHIESAHRWAVVWQTGVVIGAGIYTHFVGVATPASLAAPFVFTLALLVFAYDHGDYYEFLRRPVFQWLGERAFAMFMLQAIFLFIGVVTKDWLRRMGAGDVATLAVGTAALVLYVAVLLVAADWTYRHVELRLSGRRSVARPVSSVNAKVALVSA